jgi:hypothetical protein
MQEEGYVQGLHDAAARGHHLANTLLCLWWKHERSLFCGGGVVGGEEALHPFFPLFLVVGDAKPWRCELGRPAEFSLVCEEEGGFLLEWRWWTERGISNCARSG